MSGQLGQIGIDTVTRAVMSKYSRRGMLGALGKGGLMIAAAAVGLRTTTSALACISPPPYCNGGCNCYQSICYLDPHCQSGVCTCTKGCGKCMYPCFYVHYFYGNGCVCTTDCPPCNSC